MTAPETVAAGSARLVGLAELREGCSDVPQATRDLRVAGVGRRIDLMASMEEAAGPAFEFG